MRWDICKRRLVMGAIVTIVIAHIGVYIAAFTAIVMAVKTLPWYFASFFIMCYFSPAFTGFFCVFTQMENYLRSMIGWPQVYDDSMSHMMRKIFKNGWIIPVVMKKKD